jgi:hypothetical protein
VTKILNGRQQKRFFRPFRNKESDELGLRSDVFYDVKNRLSGRAFGSDDVDLFVVDERVPEKPDPVALANPTARAARGFRDLIVEAEPVTYLERNGSFVNTILQQKS